MSKITLADGPHTTIAGVTGSGKSTFAHALHKATPGVSIYVNPDAERGVAGVTIDMSKGDALDLSIIQDASRINLIPPDGTGTEADMDAIERLQAGLFALGENIPHDEPRFFVFIDEAHEFAPLHTEGDNPVVRLMKRGRRHNCRVFIVSQSPADLSKKAVKQSNYHVVFAVNDYSESYLKRIGLPAEAIKTTVGAPENHRFVVYDGYNVVGPLKLKEEYV